MWLLNPVQVLRVDRLRCLRNSIIPQIVTQIGYAVLEAERKD